MDKELIEMCTDERIQDRWEAKIGQMFATDDIFYYYYCIEIDNQDGAIHISNGTRKIWVCEPDEDEQVTFIPRIEDVLEWLGNGLHCLFRQTDDELYLCDEEDDEGQRWGVSRFDTAGMTEDGGFADTPIEALLKAFMHLEHSVTWDGKQWKEEG